ncbi:mycothiol-dependent nitroreductase Rv2466c family protein [Kribbella sp. CA-247076]|uniref:mycothiol-dependent nitroreductase Rv2466c family protein n=1 Tax=Kribbella sp. CA-247076 TaxID=3239941 RepID=UPI003D9298C5
MRSLDLYVDPACPWTWLAVRWLTSIAPHRDLRLTFRSHSLWMRDGATAQPPGMPEFVRAIAVATSKESTRVLRVFEALRDAGHAAAIERLYLEWGSRVFVPGPPQAPGPGVLDEALAAAGLERSWLAAADDPRWDAVIESSTAALSALVGTPVVPTLAAGPRVLFRGAVVSAPLPVDGGLEIWDALEILAAEPSFIGLSPASPPVPSFAV